MSEGLIIFVTCILVIIVIAAILLTVTPLPASKLLRAMFSKARNAPHPDNEEMKKNIYIQHDVSYPSKHKRNVVDIYLPKNICSNSFEDESIDVSSGIDIMMNRKNTASENKKAPVIIWAHGGAYVGGNKTDVKYYAIALAAKGYVVISMNYELAPEAKYPTPLIQVKEVCDWLSSQAEEYCINMNKIFLAGDSSGAHIMSQFALLQISGKYAELCGINPSLNPKDIRGILLYCGPYDASKIGAVKGPIGFLLNRAAWAYYGYKDWVKRYGEQITVIHHVEEGFPATFITDSNTASFRAHAEKLVQVLKEKSIPVDTYFMPEEEEKTMHEYQFIMNTPAGIECYNRTLEFLKKY